MRRTVIATLLFALGLWPAARVPAETSLVAQLVRNAWYWQARAREDKSAEAWEKVLAADPSNTEALRELGRWRAWSGHSEKAQELLDRLRHTNPSDPGIGMLESAIALGTRFDLLIGGARERARAGRLEEAVARYREIFGREPPGCLALDYYQTLGGIPARWAEAREGLLALTRKAPGEPRFRLALAKHLTYRAKSRAEGIRTLAQLAADPAVAAEASAAWRQALDWVSIGSDDSALGEEYLARHPGDAKLSRRLGEGRRGREMKRAFAALDRGELREADALFRTAGARDPQALAGRALVAMRRQEFGLAAALLAKAKALAPRRPRLWARLLRTARFWRLMDEARRARQAGRDADAEARLAAAAAHATPEERPEANLALADLYLGRRDARAEALLRRVLAARPEHEGAMRALVALLARSERTDEALALNERLAWANPDHAFGTGWIRTEQRRAEAARHRAAGDLEAARAALRAARHEDPGNTWVLHDLANVCLELGELGEAREAAAALAGLDPNLPAGRIVQARLLEAEGSFAKALDVLRRLPEAADLAALRRRLEVRLEADRAVARIRHGVEASRAGLDGLGTRARGDPALAAIVAQAWSDAGEQDRALRLMREVVARSPAPTRGMRLRLAGILLRAGDRSELPELLRQLSDDPGLSRAERRGLEALRAGWAIREADAQRERGDRALALAELRPLLAEAPDDPRLLCALGRLLQSAGDPAGAHAVFRRVLAKDPDDLEARQGAVEAAMAAGDLEEANRLASDALRRAPREPRLLLTMGRVAAEARDDGAAVESFRQALSLGESASGGPRSQRIAAGAEPLGANGSTGEALRAAERLVAPVAPPDPAKGGGPAPLEAEIRRELDRVEARHRLEMATGFEVRQRGGEPGLDALTELRQPLEADVPLGYRGRLRLQLTPVELNAGSLPVPGPARPLGSRAPGAAQPAGGIELRFAYAEPRLEAELGTTPLGFPLQTAVGRLHWRRTFRAVTFSAEVARRPVSDSLLSYAGVTDPATGRVWGGVVRQGAQLELSIRDGPASYTIFGGFDVLSGTGVASNQEVSGGARARLALPDLAGGSLAAGMSAYWMAYARNQHAFTLGNGGYFSPQAFVHFALPLVWSTGGPLRTEVRVEPGFNWFREASTPELPGRASAGFALAAASLIAYRLSGRLEARLALEAHWAQDYQEVRAGLQLGLALGRSTFGPTE